MSLLRETPPAAIVQRLRDENISPQDLLLCAQSDIDRMGAYKHQWLAVTDGRVLVISDLPPHEITFQMKIADATEFRTQSVVGSGLLQARVDSMYVDILRYTNRLSDIFQKVARKMERRVQGEPIVIYPEDERNDRRCQTCGLMLQFPGDVCPRCVKRGAALMRMWHLMKPYRATAATIMCLLLVGICLDLVAPQLTRYLVDNVLPGSKEAALKIKSDPVTWATHVRLLLEVVCVLAMVQVLRMCVNVCNGLLASRVGTAMTFDMRGRLVDHLQKLSVAYYDRQQIGSLVGRVAYDTEALHGFVQQLTSGFLFQLVMVIGVGIVMFTLNSKLALFTLIPAPLVMMGSMFFWRYIYPRYYRWWDASSKQAGMLSGTLSGIRVVKAFSQEDREMERFNAVSSYLRRSRQGVDFSSALFNPTMGIIFQFGGWIVWFVGGREALQGEMSLGSLMAFFNYLWMFYGPLTSLTQFTNWLTQFVTQAHRIFEILDTPQEIQEAEKPISLGDVKGEIVYDRVTFGYSRSVPVLYDIQLTIKPGEMIGVVGRSGSGKTSLINLLCRFYDVDEGRVLIDGKDVRQLKRTDLSAAIGVVLQEPFLFRGSLWQNIQYGKPTATPEEVIAATKAASAHDFILRRPHGYDTWVGERGAGLSGGERQRIGIGRVLLTDPKILILDEATSSVDVESEAAIQEALKELVKDRTTIAIAHRLSTLRNSHRILAMDRGRIIEAGTHEELMQTNGLYARLVRLQGQQATPTIDKLTEDARNDEERKKAEEEARSHGACLLPSLRGHKSRWLTPEVAIIHLGNFNALHVTIREEGIYGGVFAVRCLPVHYPMQYISLRYFDSEKREIEVGLIRDLSDWPEQAQNLIKESLLRRYFVHTILSITDIRVHNGYLNVKCETDLGPMDFMMRWQHDQAHDYGAGGKMLLDTDDNRYLIPDVSALPDAERRLFMRYIYW